MLPVYVIMLTGLTVGKEPCFMCHDGTCIRPRLPVYSTDRGKRWWWLCDDVYHCPDGTDERMGKYSLSTDILFSIQKNYVFSGAIKSTPYCILTGCTYLTATQQTLGADVMSDHFWPIIDPARDHRPRCT